MTAPTISNVKFSEKIDFFDTLNWQAAQCGLPDFVYWQIRATARTLSKPAHDKYRAGTAMRSAKCPLRIHGKFHRDLGIFLYREEKRYLFLPA